MDSFSRSELRKLAETVGGTCVSIYMPTHRGGAEVQQDPIRLKNLLRKAQDELEKQGWKEADAKALLEAPHKLIAEPGFWRQPAEGLAIFVAPGASYTYRLPLAFEESAIVNDRFHVKPLMPLLQGEGRFYLLTLNQGGIKVYSGTRSGLQELEIKDVPKNLDEALLYDNLSEASQLNFRHVNAQGHGGGGAGRGPFPGHGDEEPDKTQNIFRLYRLVDKGLHDQLKEEEVPLILAGVGHLHPIYREANTYAHLLEEGIAKDVHEMPLGELHHLAWDVVAPHFQKGRIAALERYNAQAGSSKTSHELKTVVAAAHHARIDTLFVALEHQRWGTFDAATGQVDLRLERHAGDLDLLDLAASQTFLNGGTVFALPFDQMPDQVIVAALFRY